MQPGQQTSSPVQAAVHMQSYRQRDGLMTRIAVMLFAYSPRPVALGANQKPADWTRHSAPHVAAPASKGTAASRQSDRTAVAPCVRAVRLCRRSAIAYSAIRGFACLALALVALSTIVFRVTGEIIFILFTYFVCDLSGLNLYGYSVSITIV